MCRLIILFVNKFISGPRIFDDWRFTNLQFRIVFAHAQILKSSLNNDPISKLILCCSTNFKLTNERVKFFYAYNMPLSQRWLGFQQLFNEKIIYTTLIFNERRRSPYESYIIKRNYLLLSFKVICIVSCFWELERGNLLIFSCRHVNKTQVKTLVWGKTKTPSLMLEVKQ